MNAPISEESHLETLAPSPRMVKVSKIRNIVQEVLREHYKLFASVGHSVKVQAVSVSPLPI